MKLIKFVITIFWLMFFSNALYAEEVTDLSTLLNRIQTMQADFSQKITDTKGTIIQKGYGHMALERPGKFRWQVVKPIPQTIIANQTILWIYDPDLEQVTIRSLDNMDDAAPALLLSHDHSILQRDYVVKILAAKTPNWLWFSLKPKKRDNMFAEMDLGFLGNQIQKMNLTDHLGHKTEITFQKIVMNSPLSDHLFVLKTTNKMDVIDETKKK